MNDGENRCIRANRQPKREYRSGAERRRMNQAARRMINVTPDSFDPTRAPHIVAAIFDLRHVAKPPPRSQTSLIFRQPSLPSLLDDCFEVGVQLPLYVPVAPAG
jgi:hypothetical protein